MPRRRHHLHMKRYTDCFTGAEATEWVINNLSSVKDGGQLSRQQAVKLLELCMKFDVIEDVRGVDGTLANFRDNRKHLYRFVTERPSLFGDIMGCTPSYTPSDTTRDMSLNSSSKDESLCIGNQNFLQSPAIRGVARISIGSVGKTPTGRKRKCVLGEVDINRKPTSVMKQTDVTKIWHEHIIAR